MQKEGEIWVDPLRGQTIRNEPVWAMVESPRFGVIGVLPNAFLVRKGNRWTKTTLPSERVWNGFRPFLVTRDGETLYIAERATAGMRIYQWDGKSFGAVSGVIAPDNWVEEMAEAPDGSIWIFGTRVLSRWARQKLEWTEYANVPSPTLIDKEQAVWFSKNEKTIRYLNGRFQLIHGMRGFRRIPRYNPAPVYTFSLDLQGNVWGRTADGVVRWSPTGSTTYDQGETGIKHIQGCAVDANGIVYLDGKDGNGNSTLSLFDGMKWRPLKTSELGGKAIELSTPDPKSGIWYLCAGAQSDALSLMRVDRGRLSFQPLFPGVDLSRSPGFDIILKAISG